MTLIGIAMVKNEGDIVEAFVRHNLGVLDGLVVVDNGSVDPTRRILGELAREGLRVAVVDDPDVAFAQSAKMTDLLRAVESVFRPDWVFPIDADEMICCGGRDALLTGLESVPDERIPVLPWRTYVPTEEDDRDERNPVVRIRHRRRVEKPLWTKVIVPAGALKGRPVVIGAGSHELFIGDSRVRMPTAEVPGAALAHFPVRSEDQIAGKVITGWLAYLADPSRTRGINAHWEEMYERVASGRPLSSRELRLLAMAYGLGDGTGGVVEDPLGHGETLRYVDLPSSSLVSRIARTAEQLARRAGDTCGGAPGRAATEGGAGGPSQAGIVRRHRDIPPFRYIHERFRPRSVLDIGCGPGTCLRRFEDWGVSDVVGVSPTGVASECRDEEAPRAYDLGEPLDLQRRFDVVVCVEVIGRVDPRDEDTVIDHIERHAGDVIVFSGPQPGQPGQGAMNLRPVSCWVERWAARGWRVLPWETLTFRAAATLLWLRRNALVLAREGRARGEDGPFRVQDVVAAAGGDARWHAQRAGPYEHSLLGTRLAESFDTRRQRRAVMASHHGRLAGLVWRLLPTQMKEEIRARARVPR